MGLMSFIESAGRLLGVGHENKPDAVQDESKPAPPPPEASSITDELVRLGLKVAGLNVAVDGKTAKVTGEAPDAETRDKAILAAGNIAGIAAVDSAIKTPDDAPEGSFYTVKKGDTLSAIAKSVYGKASLYPKIFEANRPMLKDADHIYPGQSLRIPPEA